MKRILFAVSGISLSGCCFPPRQVVHVETPNPLYGKQMLPTVNPDSAYSVQVYCGTLKSDRRDFTSEGLDSAILASVDNPETFPENLKHFAENSDGGEPRFEWCSERSSLNVTELAPAFFRFGTSQAYPENWTIPRLNLRESDSGLQLILPSPCYGRPVLQGMRIEVDWPSRRRVTVETAQYAFAGWDLQNYPVYPRHADPIDIELKMPRFTIHESRMTLDLKNGYAASADFTHRSVIQEEPSAFWGDNWVGRCFRSEVRSRESLIFFVRVSSLRQQGADADASARGSSNR